MKLSTLKRQLRQAATARGHSPRLRWLDHLSTLAEARCPRCGQWGQVNTCPAPNDIEIGGPLVAVGCRP